METTVNGTGVLGMDAVQFMAEYWGKRPLLIRGAFPNFKSPVGPSDVCSLACDEQLVSRIVTFDAEGRSNPPEVLHGPFEAEDFDSRTGAWTVLVQEVDRLVPEVAAFWDHFRFIPNWRIDDVMVSFATPGGTVGPHVDAYDVFLLQGMGRRTWYVGDRALEDPELDEEAELALLKYFEPASVWEVEPGDLIYLPPGFGHNGVAVDDSITFSMGFRLPKVADVVAGYLSDVLSRMSAERLLPDRRVAPSSEPGLLDFESLEQVRTVVRALAYDEQAITEWFGRFVTEPMRAWEADGPAVSMGQAVSALRSGMRFERAAVPLCAYADDPDDGRTLFVLGEAISLPEGCELIGPLVCGSDELTADAVLPLLEFPDARDVFSRLLAVGFLRLAERR